jgi:hypothetical protein
LVQVQAEAHAGTCHVETVTHTLNGFIYVGTVEVCTGDVVETSTIADTPATDSGLDSICVQTALSIDRDPFEFCAEPDGDAPPEITPGMVAAAFRFLSVPPSMLVVQPPNGRTLVNFDTNFYTESLPVDRSVTLLDQRVDLHIVPSQFTWQFGDGGSLATAEPGAPYPDLEVTHRYVKKGKVAPSVDTTYAATYSVNGGPWLDVPGTVTIAGPPVDLQVLTATPTLVGYDRG